MSQTKLFLVSEAWKIAYPGAQAGLLVMHNVVNPEHHEELDKNKAELESRLREQLSGMTKKELSLLPSVRPYVNYYGRYKKTYHVQLQLESVALKHKPIARASALVEAMFMAELKNQLLTAGHDLEGIRSPVKLEVAVGSESYTLLSGQTQVAKADDMMMADEKGIISSVLYGPDRRTSITPATRRVLFAVYAPPGIPEQALRQHLADIRANVKLVSPEAEVELERVYGTD